MKSFLWILAAFGLVATVGESKAAWLKSGWIYADSEKDMNVAVRFANHKDLGALDQMDRENKISLSSDKEFEVSVIETPFLSGLVSFNFKGSSDTYWTYVEAISETPRVVTAAPPVEERHIDGSHQEIINGQVVTVLPN